MAGLGPGCVLGLTPGGTVAREPIGAVSAALTGLPFAERIRADSTLGAYEGQVSHGYSGQTQIGFSDGSPFARPAGCVKRELVESRSPKRGGI